MGIAYFLKSGRLQLVAPETPPYASTLHSFRTVMRQDLAWEVFGREFADGASVEVVFGSTAPGLQRLHSPTLLPS